MSEQVTVNEIIKSINFPSPCKYYNAGLINRIKAHGIAPPIGYALVPIEDCLLCKNTGIFGMGVGDAYDANTSCVCVSKPQSRYNVNKTMLSAVKDKP